MQRTLKLLQSSEVRDQDIYMPAAGLRGHPEGVEALWTWLSSNWDEVYRRFPPALPMLGHLVTIFSSGFATPAQLAKLEKFFADKNQNGYDKSLAQSMDSIRSKIAWIERDRADVAAWLKANGYSS